MHAVEWRLSPMINRNKNLINKLDHSKPLPLVRNISHVPFNI